ncbi:hypothetical protein ACT17Q_00890 [Cellulomonas sp. CW35]|uniref:hypothetical protein n=1 Tax=Cellulomonas sp. CW35 TaxID=3458249 RepID=UPI0040348EF4
MGRGSRWPAVGVVSGLVVAAVGAASIWFTLSGGRTSTEVDWSAYSQGSMVAVSSDGPWDGSWLVSRANPLLLWGGAALVALGSASVGAATGVALVRRAGS